MSAQTPDQPPLPALPPASRASRAATRLFGGMRIRKKLIILHTSFSLALALILGLALRPAIREVVARAELHEAKLMVELALEHGVPASGQPRPSMDRASVEVLVGDAARVGLSPAEVSLVKERVAELAAGRTAAREDDGFRSVVLDDPQRVHDRSPRVGAMNPRTGEFIVASVRLEGARDAVVRLYLLMTIALLAVYGLVAAALEIFVLPRHVYGPIRRILAADDAVQEGKRDQELIENEAIPVDELGEIMRSRNESIRALRRHEKDLAAALYRLEEVATDLKKKNHLLEAARRNLADVDRLASLGVMSAGLAHEMNTPLAVLKGLAEKVARLARAAVPVSTVSDTSPHASSGTISPADLSAQSTRHESGTLSPSEADLMLRVVGRLERLSDGLLDFARTRPAKSSRLTLAPVVEEAWTLVRLDRGAADVALVNRIAPDAAAECDPDRIMQVLVNLLRNAVDAMEGASTSSASSSSSALPAVSVSAAPRLIEVDSHVAQRDGECWTSITIGDCGPGIDPEVLANLFEPFVSTRLDSRGTGLGLAVSEGIISEHGGLLLARNRQDRTGAVFEILLPLSRDQNGEVTE